MRLPPLDIVFFCFTEKWWDWERLGFWGRTAALAKALAEHDDVRRVLVVDTPSSVGRMLLSRDSRPGAPISGVPGLRQAAEKVFVLDQARLLPRERHSQAAFAANGAIHDGSLGRRLRQAIASLGMERPVVWLAGPTVARYAEQIDASAVVYDAVDEWLAHPAYEGVADAAAAGYEWVRDRADLVFAVTPTLAGRFSGGRPRVVVLPNAADPVDPAAAQEVAALAEIPTPRIGYVGVLEDRLDVSLILEVARKMRDASFVFVGPVDNARHIQPLASEPNVFLTGACRPHEVADYLLEFDACMLPHLDTPLTRNMDPVKLHEYAAAGRPTVASAISGLAWPPSFVRVARNADDWVRDLRDALSGEWRISAEEVAEHATRNTWQARADAIVREIRILSPATAPSLMAGGERA